MPNTQSRWFEITRLSSQAEPRGTGRTRLGWRLPWQSNRGRFTPFQAKHCGFLGEVKCVNIAGAFEKKTETHCWSPQGFLLIELSNLLSLLSAEEQEHGAAARNPPCVLGQTGWGLLFLAGGVWGLQDPPGHHSPVETPPGWTLVPTSGGTQALLHRHVHCAGMV